MRVIVVGAGLGGLSAAAHLRGRGHDVLVLERAAVPGGRNGLLELGGYRFDTGPTVFTMPDLLRRCFEAVGAEMDDFVTLRPVDPMYRATFHDGSELRVWHGRERMAQEIRDVVGADAARAFGRFADWLTQLERVETPHFIDANFDSPLDLLRPLKPALDLVRLGGFGRLGSKVASYFDDHRLQKLFSFQSMYAGLAPYEALAIYCVITYMDTIEGVFFPEGGMHAVPAGLARAVEKAGVELRYGVDVDRIVLAEGTRGRVRGVHVSDGTGGGELLEADAVVCNADLPVAYRTLLPGLKQPFAVRHGHYSPSCALWHVGVTGALPERTAHHNIHFGEDWDGAFEDLLKRGTRMGDPSILVTVHSLDEPTLVPQPGDGVDRHSLYVLEPVPNLDGHIDWSVERERLHDSLQQRLLAMGYPVAAGDIEVEAFVDPADWERQGMERGTPFALSHRFRQTGPFRPGNVTKHAPGLVFTGSGTLPGVGVPMVLVSGRLAAERVDQLERA
ncbi:MAG TPA: phytoene desaturase family protein [Acidimicrobiales bacterium]|nr:phytoene desaturase family protein [Acidimicrobiales bacterium]